MTGNGKDRLNRECPNCGMHAMPSALYCLRCGEELPPLQQRAELVEREAERKRIAGRLWLFDLFPGLLNLRVLILSVVLWTSAIAMALFTEMLMQGITGLEAMFFLPAAALAGFIGLMLFTVGLLFILHGRLANPLEALSGMPGRRWPVFLGLLFFGLGLYGFIRSLM